MPLYSAIYVRQTRSSWGNNVPFVLSLFLLSHLQRSIKSQIFSHTADFAFPLPTINAHDSGKTLLEKNAQQHMSGKVPCDSRCFAVQAYRKFSDELQRRPT